MKICNQYYYLNSKYSLREREEREIIGRGKRDNFCVINVKYKEISWRVRGEEEEKSNF